MASENVDDDLTGIADALIAQLRGMDKTRRRAVAANLGTVQRVVGNLAAGLERAQSVEIKNHGKRYHIAAPVLTVTPAARERPTGVDAMFSQSTVAGILEAARQQEVGEMRATGVPAGDDFGLLLYVSYPSGQMRSIETWPADATVDAGGTIDTTIDEDDSDLAAVMTLDEANDHIDARTVEPR